MAGADDLVKQAQNLADKAQELAKDHPEQAKQAVDRIEDLVDKATGGRFSGQVDSIGDALTEKLTGGDRPAS